MEKLTEFDEIRPYYDEELPRVFEELTADPEFQHVISFVFPEEPIEIIMAQMRQCATKREFQKKYSDRFLWNVANNSTDGIGLDISSLPQKEAAYTYISNHRDIVLDSGFLSILLLDKGLDTVEIAIGDNLLFLPWIKQLVRINKSFIVQRGLNMRQFLESATRLSRYMHHAIADKKESLWIAQREGRAKDSNDRTQDSILKMLAMAGEGDIIDRLKSLNIAPLAISYEYDPCDFLKAEEFQLKRDLPDYKKTFKDDLKNMQTGIMGYKGKVHFRTGRCLNGMLDAIDRSLPKQELYATISGIIDREIHRNYLMHPANYIAYDLLKDDKRFADKYSAHEKSQFQHYLARQLDKIEMDNKDIAFLTEKMLTMYANPLINHLEAIKE